MSTDETFSPVHPTPTQELSMTRDLLLSFPVLRPVHWRWLGAIALVAAVAGCGKPTDPTGPTKLESVIKLDSLSGPRLFEGLEFPAWWVTMTPNNRWVIAAGIRPRD